MRSLLVPMMLISSSVIMAFAWLGHLKFDRLTFFQALALSWLIVLPEYLLNVAATRWGHGLYSGAQMAAINLTSGVVCVALVSRFFLEEPISMQQISGFALMVVAICLITFN